MLVRAFRKQPGRGRQTAGSPRQTVIAGHEVLLTIKRIKNMYMRIKPPDGHIEISMPAGMGMTQLERFVRSHGDWIAQEQNRVRSAAKRTNPDGPDPQATPVPGTFEGWDEARAREAKARLNAALPDLLVKWTSVVGKAPTAITLRLMRTRWGSCTPATGRIRLNLALAFMPPRFLEYVLVHELTHLWAGGHGREFQRRMDMYLPDWRSLRRELNRDYVL